MSAVVSIAHRSRRRFSYRRALITCPTGSAGRSDLPLHRHTSFAYSHILPIYTGIGTYFLDLTMSNLRSIRNSDAAPRLDRGQYMLLPKINLHPSNSSKQYVCYACSRSFQRRGGFVRHHCESAVPPNDILSSIYTTSKTSQTEKDIRRASNT